MAALILANEPLLGALLDYWERKRGSRAMPRRADIDPLDMPARLLPHVQLIERGGLRFRLVGTAVVDALGKDPTGRSLEDAFAGPERDFLERFFGAVLRAKRPVVGRSWLRKARGPDLGAAWLATPLSEDGRDANMLLVAASFRFARRRSLAEDHAASEESIDVL